MIPRYYILLVIRCRKEKEKTKAKPAVEIVLFFFETPPLQAPWDTPIARADGCVCYPPSPCSCQRCKKDNQCPKLFSSDNNMYPGSVPAELQGLSQTEEMLIARSCPIMRVIHLKGGQLGSDARPNQLQKIVLPALFHLRCPSQSHQRPARGRTPLTTVTSISCRSF